MDSCAFSVGDKIKDRYLVCDTFRGAMGKVYLVRDLSHEDEKNLPPLRIAKTILPSVQAPGLYERFLDEASVWINIGKQKNAVYAYSVESIDGVPYVFAEYIHRGVLPLTLAEWIHYRLLPAETALYFMVQVLDGLWYNYQSNVEFHGDLKPGNILINQDVEVKINDWGWAHASDRPISSRELDCFARYHGVSSYIAPELRCAAPRLTRAMDGYAIGVMLGEMLTYRQWPAGTGKEEIESEMARMHFGMHPSMIASLSEIIAELVAGSSGQRANFYDNYGREISDIFQELSGIHVLDERGTIIIGTLPEGHHDRVERSMNVLNDLQKSTQRKEP